MVKKFKIYGERSDKGKINEKKLILNPLEKCIICHKSTKTPKPTKVIFLIINFL